MHLFEKILIALKPRKCKTLIPRQKNYLTYFVFISIFFTPWFDHKRAFFSRATSSFFLNQLFEKKQNKKIKMFNFFAKHLVVRMEYVFTSYTRGHAENSDRIYFSSDTLLRQYSNIIFSNKCRGDADRTGCFPRRTVFFLTPAKRMEEKWTSFWVLQHYQLAGRVTRDRCCDFKNIFAEKFCKK
jgi:hypothetical protein